MMPQMQQIGIESENLAGPISPVELNETDNYFLLSNEYQTYKIMKTGIQVTNPPNEWAEVRWCAEGTVGATTISKCVSEIEDLTWQNGTDALGGKWLYGRGKFTTPLGNLWIGVNYSLTNWSDKVQVEVGAFNDLSQPIQDLLFSYSHHNITIANTSEDDYAGAYVNNVWQTVQLNETDLDQNVTDITNNTIRIFNGTARSDYIEMNWTNPNAYVYLRSQPYQEYNTPVRLIIPAGNLDVGQTKSTIINWIDASPAKLDDDSASGDSSIQNTQKATINWNYINNGGSTGSWVVGLRDDGAYITDACGGNNFYIADASDIAFTGDCVSRCSVNANNYYVDITNALSTEDNLGVVYTLTACAVGSNTLDAEAVSGDSDALPTTEHSITVTVADTFPPNTTIKYPLNKTYNINISQLNYTIVDNAALDTSARAWYSRDGGITNSSTVAVGTNFTNVISNEGTNNWTLYTNDTKNNLNKTGITFYKDTIYPRVNVTFPINNTNHSINNININYTLIELKPQTCWWSNNTGRNNKTLASCGTNITGQVWNEGINNVTVWANDTSGNVNSSSVIFYIDTTKPLVVRLSPDNITYVDNASITYNVSVNEYALCFFSLDSFVTNTSMTQFNSTLHTYSDSSLSDGSHVINFTCNDSANNINMTSGITFSTDTTAIPSWCDGAINNTANTEWIIDWNVICNSENVLLGQNSNITITTGNLTIMNATNITYSMTADGKGHINKSAQGGLWIYDAVITSDNPSYEYDFWVEGNGENDNFTLQNSNITETGWQDIDIGGSGGIQLNNIRGVIIKGNSITNNFYGLQIYSSSNNKIINNTFDNNVHDNIMINGNSLVQSNNNTIESNKILNSGRNGIIINTYSSNNTIVSNNILNSGDSAGEYGINIYSAIGTDGQNISYNFINNSYDSNILIYSSNNYVMYNNITFSFVYNGIEIVTSKNNNIQGNMVLGNTAYGISIGYSSSNNIIQNNAISSTSDSIYIDCSSGQTCDNTTISNNNITNSGRHGINIVDYSENNTIANNRILDSGDSPPAEYGIYIGGTLCDGQNITSNIINNSFTANIYTSSDNNFIYNNSITSSNDGIIMSTSSGNSILDNQILNNFQYGIDNSVSSNNIIKGNFINNSGAVAISFSIASNNNIVSGNEIKNSVSDNIYLVGNPGSMVLNTTIKDNNISNSGRHGIYILQYSENNTIANNRILDNGDGAGEYGIYVGATSCDGQNITLNLINNSYSSGIYIASNDNEIYENNISNNNDGIYVSSSRNNNIDKNTIYENTHYGVYLYSSSNNSITRSNIYDNGWEGVLLFLSSNNTLDNNIINSNTQNNVYIAFASKNNIIKNNLINSSGSGYNNIYIACASGNTCDNTTIQNNNITNAGRHGINIYDYSENNTIYNNRILDNGDAPLEKGIYVGATSCDGQNISNNLINNSFTTNIYIESDDNVIYNNNITNSNDGMTLLNSHRNSIKNNYILNNSQYGIEISTGQNYTIENNDIESSGAVNLIITGSESNNNLIGGNRVKYSVAHNIYLSGNLNAISINNTLENNNITNAGQNGIYIFAYSENNTIKDNRIDNCADNGIYIGNTITKNHTILNNLITNSGKNGIYIGDDNVNLTSNSFYGNAEWDINLSLTENVAFYGNGTNVFHNVSFEKPAKVINNGNITVYWLYKVNATNYSEHILPNANVSSYLNRSYPSWEYQWNDITDANGLSAEHSSIGYVITSSETTWYGLNITANYSEFWNSTINLQLDTQKIFKLWIPNMTGEAPPVEDPCDYTSGDWTVPCWANCSLIDTERDVQGNVYLYGCCGKFTIAGSNLSYDNFYRSFRSCKFDRFGSYRLIER